MAAYRNRIVGHGEEAPDDLMANPLNYRVHPKAQTDATRGSLSEVGWVKDIIVNRTTGRIIDGHLRVELAIADSEPMVPIVYVELTEDEERIVLAALDPLTGLATHDQDILDQLIKGTRVEDDDLAAFLESLLSQDALNDEKEGQTGDDDAPPALAETVSVEGDIWILGNHRLLCGDATDPEAVAGLLEETQADMVWTDPPYNVNYEGGTADALKIENDNMDDGAFRLFLRDAFTTAFIHTREGGGIYIAHADTEGRNFRGALEESGFMLKQCLIWVKNALVLGRQDYQWQHEPILYGWKPGAAHKWYGEFDKTTVIDDDVDVRKLDKPRLIRMINQLRTAMNSTVMRVDKPSRSSDHPTMKPVDLIVHMLRNSSKRGDTVLDLFGGSGSTLIACEKLYRKARLVELDPRYCDVIIRRWQEYTGEDATLADGTPFDELNPGREAA